MARMAVKFWLVDILIVLTILWGYFQAALRELPHIMQQSGQGNFQYRWVGHVSSCC